MPHLLCGGHDKCMGSPLAAGIARLPLHAVQCPKQLVLMEKRCHVVHTILRYWSALVLRDVRLSHAPAALLSAQCSHCAEGLKTLHAPPMLAGF